VHCAGESQQSLLLRTPEDAIDSLLAANLRTVVLGSAAVGKAMARRGAGGCIINVSSLLARQPMVGTSVYAAAKAGQLGTYSLTGERERGLGGERGGVDEDVWQLLRRRWRWSLRGLISASTPSCRGTLRVP
jgi:hypothetical protein